MANRSSNERSPNSCMLLPSGHNSNQSQIAHARIDASVAKNVLNIISNQTLCRKQNQNQKRNQRYMRTERNDEKKKRENPKP